MTQDEQIVKIKEIRASLIARDLLPLPEGKSRSVGAIAGHKTRAGRRAKEKAEPEEPVEPEPFQHQWTDEVKQQARILRRIRRG